MIEKLTKEIKYLLEEETTYNWSDTLDSKARHRAFTGKGGYTIEQAKEEVLKFIEKQYDKVMYYEPEYGEYESEEPIFYDYGENGIIAIGVFGQGDFNEIDEPEWEEEQTFYIFPEGYVTEFEKSEDKRRELIQRFGQAQKDINKKIYDLFEPFDFLSLLHHSGLGPVIEICKVVDGYRRSKILDIWFSTDGSPTIGVDNKYKLEYYIKYEKGTDKDIINCIKEIAAYDFSEYIGRSILRPTEEDYAKVIEQDDRLYNTAKKIRDIIEKYKDVLSKYAEENECCTGSERRISLA